MRILLTSLVLFLTTTPSHALSLAFLRIYDDGRPRELVPGGQFSHVAMRVGGRWLHAHPDLGMGVAFTDTLDGFGEDVEIYTNPAVPEPAAWQVEYWLGLEFNQRFEWNDYDGTTYCSKFPAEYLGIEPTPAHFMSGAWDKHVGRYGGVGVSPDELKEKAKAKGFTRDFALERSCEPRLALGRAH